MWVPFPDVSICAGFYLYRPNSFRGGGPPKHWLFPLTWRVTFTTARALPSSAVMATALTPMKLYIPYLNSQTPKTFWLCDKFFDFLHRTEISTILTYFCLNLAAMATPWLPWKGGLDAEKGAWSVSASRPLFPPPPWERERVGDGVLKSLLVAYLVTWLLTYLLGYLLTWLLTYLLSYLVTYLVTWLLTWLLTYLITYLLAYLLTYLLGWLLIHLVTYLLTYLLTY